MDDMTQYKTKGIILRRRNFGEADRLLTIYTEQKGKVSAIAKGVRKPLSKLGGHLELFYLVDFVITKGKNIDIITAVDLIKDFPKLRIDLKSTNQAHYTAEVLDRLICDNEPNQDIFDLLISTLSKTNRRSKPLLLNYFALQLLFLLGHKPELYKCVVCGRKLSKEDNHFSYRLGGIIDKDCWDKDLQSLSITADEIKVIRLLLNHNISITEKLVVDDIKNLTKIVRGFLESITEKEIKSGKFI